MAYIPQSRHQPKPPLVMTKRRKVAKACLFCKRSHMTCDDSRPCQRCIKREIGHLCCDEPPSAGTSSGLAPTLHHQAAPNPPLHSSSTTTTSTPPTTTATTPAPPSSSSSAPAAAQDHHHHPKHHSTHPLQDRPLLHSSHSSLQLALPPDLPSTTPRPTLDSTLSTPPIESLNHPIHSISHLASLLTPRLLLSPSSSSDSPHANTLDPAFAFFRHSSTAFNTFEELTASHEKPIDQLSRSTGLFDGSQDATESKIDGPMIDLNEFLNAYPSLMSESQSPSHQNAPQKIFDHHHHANGISPAAIDYTRALPNSNNSLCDALSPYHHHASHPDLTLPRYPVPTQDRLAQIIRGSGLEPFDYSESHKELYNWIQTKMPEPSKAKMLAIWNESHNLFSSTVSQQSVEDMIESEYQFKRNLITCIPILDTLPVPGCIWRRSGEIYKTNEQFNLLIGIHSFGCSPFISSLLSNHQLKNNHENSSKLIRIHQLWDPESYLNFCEKFNRIALDEGQKAVLTSCVLYQFKEREDPEMRNEEKPILFTSSPSPASPLPSPSLPAKDKAGESKPIATRPSIEVDLARSQVEGQPSKTESRPKNVSRDSSLLKAIDQTYDFLDSGQLMIVSARISCTFSFTVRRDSFGLPSLIIGNFLPS